jgi:hypothetical protein
MSRRYMVEPASSEGTEEVDKAFTIILPENRELKVPWDVARDWDVS